MRNKIVGGLRTPKDETGDCFKFTNALATKAEQLGVRFWWDTEVKRPDVEGGRVRSVVISWERLASDAVGGMAEIAGYTNDLGSSAALSERERSSLRWSAWTSKSIAVSRHSIQLWMPCSPAQRPQSLERGGPYTH